MGTLLALLALSLAPTDCRGQAQVCLEAQVECVEPMTRTDLYRCARFSTWCALHMTPACSEEGKKTTIAMLRADWWKRCMIVTNDPEVCAKLE